MLKYTFLAFCLFFVYYPNGILSDTADQDHLVKPLLDMMVSIQELITTCEATQINNTNTRFDRIEEQLEAMKKEIPENFEKIGSRYFYFEENRKENWFSAANMCRQKGGSLASIQSDEEFTAIKRHPKRDPNEHYWLDINDLAEEGMFMSVTTGQIAPFLMWAHTEPNNLDNLEHCVDLYWQHMHDDFCHEKYYFYICQSEK